MRIFVALFLCVMGWFCAPPVHAADSCEAGYFLNDNGECEICPGGYYCPGNGQKNECGDRVLSDFVFEDILGLSRFEDCQVYVNPGTFFECSSDFSCRESACVHGLTMYEPYYCPGGSVSVVELNGSDWGGTPCGPRYRCPDNIYLNTEYPVSIEDCIPCPKIDYEDSCETSYGEMICFSEGDDDIMGVESCYDTQITRVFVASGIFASVVTRMDLDGSVVDFTVRAECADGTVFEQTFATMSEALDVVNSGVPICPEDLASGCAGWGILCG